MLNGLTEWVELADNKVRSSVTCSITLSFLKYTPSRHTQTFPFPRQGIDLILKW